MSKHEEIPWDDKYRLGIDMIDTQHKKLFTLINKLYKLEDHKSTKDEFKEILYEFSEYMKNHFTEEEEYMSSINYPALEEHKLLHQHLIDQLFLVIKSSGKLSILKTKMRIIAKRALIEHIRYEDSKIKLFEISEEKPEQLIYDEYDISNIEAEEIDDMTFDITDIVPDI